MRPADGGAHLSGPNGHLADLCYSTAKMRFGPAHTEWPVVRSNGRRVWAGEVHPSEMMDGACPQPEGTSISCGKRDHRRREARHALRGGHGFLPNNGLASNPRLYRFSKRKSNARERKRRMATELSTSEFESVLRLRPMAFVAFTAPWCVHCRTMLPEFERAALRYTGSSVLFATVNSDGNEELLDRFGVESFPRLLWFDGTARWPLHALRADPELYVGGLAAADLTSFIQSRSGISPSQSQSDPELPAPTSPTPPVVLPPHACTEHSAEYVECMRYRQDRPEMCLPERRRYLGCMSGRWSVHADHHESLAAEFGRFAIPGS